MLIRELLENYILTEARTDFALTQFGKKIDAVKSRDHKAANMSAEEIIAELAKISEKDIIWLCSMYIAKQFLLEDAPRMKEELKKFAKYKSKMEVKDLTQFKTLNAFYDAIEAVEGTDTTSKRQAEKEMKSKDAPVFFEGPGIKVVMPKTEETACTYGAGTKWCTAADNNNMFKHYHDQGQLYIIMAKLEGKDRKFQIHFETDSFMDERDQTISKKDIDALSELPAYKDFLNKMIKKYYGV